MLQINKIYNLDCCDFLNQVQKKSVDLAIIDPPYNMKKAYWDTFKSHRDFLEFTFKWIDALIPTLKETGSLYIFNTPFNCAYILRYLVDKGLIFRNWITWDKRDGMGTSKSKYSNGQESILFFTKSSKHTFNYDDIRVPYESVERIGYAFKKGILKNGNRWFPNPKGRFCSEVWHIVSERHKNKVNGKTVKNEHIASKPLELIERIIKASSNEEDLVLDCFVGSGTTAVASKKLNRNFICNDFDNEYVSLSLKKLRITMTDFDFLKGFKNDATNYLLKRLQNSKYRGQHLVQHYRYDFDTISKILQTLNEYAPNGMLMEMRIDSPKWKNFCKDVSYSIGKGTQYSIRKNLFVDLARIGLICRYNKDKKLNDPYKKRNNCFVSLRGKALEVIKNPQEIAFFIFTAIDTFLNGCIEEMLNILKDSDIKRINIYEYMFFITAINSKSNFILTRNKAVEYIKKYRELNEEQRKCITRKLRDIMKPDEKAIKGKDKKDFHNWKNETDSLFDNFLSKIPQFDVTGTGEGKSIKWRTNESDRSLGERQKYMKEHNIKERSDKFELHHIIPLLYSTLDVDKKGVIFKMLDDWRNMIYISVKIHKSVTKQHVILDKGEGEDLKLVDRCRKEICLKRGVDILYNYNKQKAMLEKNKELRKTLSKLP